MGPKCPKALWHSIHTPDEAEPLPAWAEFKFSFGHLIEGLTLALAKAAGHTVEGEQDAVEVDGVVGHRDAIVDGCLVDVKSTASPMFKRFENQFHEEADRWGYLSQLDGYLVGSRDDPRLLVKDKGYILCVDKQLGHMRLHEHRLREEHIRARVKEYKNIVEKSEPPACLCGTAKDGESGNIKLDTSASYNPFKYSCFPHLRTFLYSGGPRYLTKVVRKPDVPEIDRFGNVFVS